MADKAQSVTQGRLTLGAVGAFAGLCLWLLVDVLADRMDDTPRLFLFLVCYYGVFFTSLLALIGPMRLPRAALFSAALAVVVALLLIWASLRFEDVKQFINTPRPFAAAALLALVPLPFAISRAREGAWASYPALFGHSWDIVVRYAAGWVFVGVVWGVVMLSDALLQLVGIKIIEQLLDIEVIPYLLTGLTLGVALAVVNELSDYVSPYLVLRLLRLLLPAVLGVVAVFLLALPFRGLSHLFGTLSAAATLMAMAIGATTLVTTALDADGENAVQSPAMRGMVQLLALLLPALGGLAFWAIWLRVNQYGWTPDRLAAALLALLVLAYGAAYAVAVILRRGWARRIRAANVVLALVVMAAAAAWLTPLINPQRLSTNSQIARFAAGKVDAETLDLWSIGREWGRAGRAGLARLEAMQDAPDADVLTARIAAVKEARSRYALDRQAGDSDAKLQALADAVRVLPEGATLPEAFLKGMTSWRRDQLTAGCARATPAGNPGCIALRIDVFPDYPGDEVIIAVLVGANRVALRGYSSGLSEGVVKRRMVKLKGGEGLSLTPADLDALFAGNFSIVPTTVRTLHLMSGEYFFSP